MGSHKLAQISFHFRVVMGRGRYNSQFRIIGLDLWSLHFPDCEGLRGCHRDQQTNRTSRVRYSIHLNSRYNIGIRLVEEYLAKTRTRGIRSFRESCENIATKALPMYAGTQATVENWNEDEQSCIISTILEFCLTCRIHYKSSHSLCRTS